MNTRLPAIATFSQHRRGIVLPSPFHFLMVCVSLVGCTTPTDLLDDKPCPCVSGFVCDTVTNRCLPEGTDAGHSRDSGTDVGADAGPDGAVSDSGPDAPTDAGFDADLPPSVSTACWRRPTGCDWSSPSMRLVEVPDSAFASLGNISNPTFAPDGCGIYYSLFESGEPNLWRTRRASADAAFGTSVALSELNSDAADYKATISPDGLEIFLSTTRGGADRRARLFRSRRGSATAAWPPPQPADEFEIAGHNLYDPALSPNGLRFYYAPGTAEAQLLHEAQRAEVGDPFDPPNPLDPGDLGFLEGGTTFAEPVSNFDDTLLVYVVAFEDGGKELFFSHRNSWHDTWAGHQTVPLGDGAGEVQDMGLSPDACELVVRFTGGDLVHYVYESD